MRAFERYLTEQEQQRLLRHMQLRRADGLAMRDGALMRLLMYSGMRLGETLALSQGDALAAIRSGWLFIPREHRKGGTRDHTVRCTAPVVEALRDLLAARALLRPDERVSPETAALLVGRTGQRLGARGVQKRIQAWCVEAGIDGRVTPHWFRHTRAKNIMRRTTSNDPRGIVQAALGHASISSTAVYTEVSKEDLVAALDEVDGPGDRRAVKRGLRRAYEQRQGAA